MVTYERPYTYNEVVDNYGEEAARRLFQDPAHRYRMETGIELIHKEPTVEELDRIYENYRRMPIYMRRLSNAKSKTLFGINNRAHYKQLKSEY